MRLRQILFIIMNFNKIAGQVLCGQTSDPEEARTNSFLCLKLKSKDRVVECNRNMGNRNI